MKCPYRRKRITFRVSEQDYRQLLDIVQRGNLVNVSGLLKYVVYCLLRAYNTGEDGVYDECPVEIVRLFRDTLENDSAAISAAVEMIRKKEKARRMHEGNLRFDNPDDRIGDEVKGMFRDCEDDGKRRAFSDDINKRK